MASGGLHGAVEVERDPRQAEGGQALKEHLSKQPAEVVHALGIGVLEHAADRGHIGQTFEAEQPLDHRIVAIRSAVAQFAKAQQEVNDQLQDNRRWAEGLAAAQMTEASAQALLEIECCKE